MCSSSTDVCPTNTCKAVFVSICVPLICSKLPTPPPPRPTRQISSARLRRARELSTSSLCPRTWGRHLGFWRHPRPRIDLLPSFSCGLARCTSAGNVRSRRGACRCRIVRGKERGLVPVVSAAEGLRSTVIAPPPPLPQKVSQDVVVAAAAGCFVFDFWFCCCRLFFVGLFYNKS